MTVTDLFHPLIQRWFDARYSAPTDIQQQAWPHIAAGDNLLLTAPTGSGKTLTAFLWALNQFATGDLEPGATRVLYVSPLKALNNDIQRNLLAPLAELEATFTAADVAFPAISVQTRSGDTDQDVRRRMLRKPPEILITTPESLNLMLTSAASRAILHSITTVILDEIHSVVDSKRGVYLMSAVERLVPYAGEFQRIALSATVNPLESVASFVAGYVRRDQTFTARDIRVLQSTSDKQYDIRVVQPDETRQRPEDEQIWTSLAADFVRRIENNRSTLLFVNSRALCERVTYLINQQAGRTLAWAHHGSLSREIRQTVEANLKAGKLAAIVATSTLEMGIDIGELDEVLLIQAPGSIAATIQRIGRAGHNVGDTSRCVIYPTHPRDFVEACVLGDAVIARDLEAVKIVRCPLDVLAQIIVSMSASGPVLIDELFAECRRSDSFHDLTRLQFDLVIDMLGGRYADNHIRDLRPRVTIDLSDGTIEARRGAVLGLYMSGGVIPDRGYFQIRHAESGARIGDLDEEFVWEARVGQVFSFGTQDWRVRKITHNDVLVVPGKPGGLAPPFWRSEPISRSFHYASRVGRFLDHADQLLDQGGGQQLQSELRDRYHADDNSAGEIVSFLTRQKLHTRAALPGRHHLLLETINRGPGGTPGTQMVLHTGWGARVNRPLAMALEAALAKRGETLPTLHIDNESIVLQLAEPLSLTNLLTLVTPESLEGLLRYRLEGSGFFGARFRENAGRALLLSKGRFNERKPLWMSRLQSQKLLEATLRFEDFPIMLETWRTCLRDEFDLRELQQVLEEVASGEIRTTEVISETPSPFAQSIAWDQINTYMYQDDSREGQHPTSQLRQSLIEEVAGNPALRPRLPTDLVTGFEAKRQRRVNGYAPIDLSDLVDWVKERTLIPLPEWPETIIDLESPLTPRLQQHEHFFAATDDAALVTADTDEAMTTLLGNVLQYYGPVTVPRMAALTGFPEGSISTALAQLTSDETLVSGQLLADDETHYWCDAGNYETLLRQLRQLRRLTIDPQPITALPVFLHTWQTRLLRSKSPDKNGTTDRNQPGAASESSHDTDILFDTIALLRALPLSAALIETDVLPARCDNYDPAQLDALFADQAVTWQGVGKATLSLMPAGDDDLLPPVARESSLLPGSVGRRSFAELQETTGHSSDALAEQLWQEAWSGQVSNDTYAAVRRGLESGFKVPAPASFGRGTGRRLQRGGFQRWRAAVPFSGNWFGTPTAAEPLDLLEREELNKDRVRVLLDRYGILFRELLQRELPTFQWRALFRSLRLMELSGEVVTGYFFADVPGPQFMDPAAIRYLEAPEQSFWINAADPISPCGLGLEKDLPRRVSANYLVYDKGRIALTVERNGARLHFRQAPEDTGAAVLDVFAHLLYRQVSPLRKITLTEINGEPARNSGYRTLFEQRFRVVSDHRGLYLERQL